MKPEHAALLAQAEQDQQHLMEELDKTYPTHLAWTVAQQEVDKMREDLRKISPLCEYLLTLGSCVYTMHRYRKYADDDTD